MHALRPAAPFILLTALAALLVGLTAEAMPWDKFFPDVICYWAAGKLLAHGQSPYAPSAPTAVQQAAGWDRAPSGLGTYDFLPFFYPPWFGFLWLPLAPFGLHAAKVAWFFLNVQFALLAGYLLRPAVPTL